MAAKDQHRFGASRSRLAVDPMVVMGAAAAPSS
jgi:hypothetical protein